MWEGCMVVLLLLTIVGLSAGSGLLCCCVSLLKGHVLAWPFDGIYDSQY